MSEQQWEEYLHYYNEQKRLEKYQRDRELAKPNTTKTTVFVYVAVLVLALAGGVSWVVAFSPFKVWIKLIMLLLYIPLLTETYGRLVGIKVVECYQHYASEATRRKCKCVPSCSEYAIACLKKYELVYALLKIRKRLFVTCKGFDYILDDP